MSKNTIWNGFASNNTINSSVQLDLTPTVLNEASNRDPSSLLSLSNYLQYDDSSIFYHEKYPFNNQRNQKEDQKMVKKSHLFTEIRTQYQKSHLIPSFQHQDQESQSMLLLDSGVKSNNRQFEDSFNLIESKQILTEAISQQNLQHNENKEFLLSRIHQKNSLSNKYFCYDSVQLMDLLCIPKEFQQSILRQSIKSIKKDENQFQKMKKMMQIISHYQININQTQQNQCKNCVTFEKRIKNLEHFLGSKQKQILKYQELIEQLNSKNFDLKIQNKRITFQNQQYLYKLQGFLSQRIKVCKKQRHNTISYQSENDSFLNEEKPEFINNSFISRAQQKNNLIQQKGKSMFTFQEKNKHEKLYLSPSKAYPQTPMPTMTYLKPKRERKPSNFSDHSLQVSISKVKEPTVFQIAEKKIQKIFMQKNIKCYDQQKQFEIKNQNGMKRFSDLLNQTKNQSFDDTSDRISFDRIFGSNKKNKSPLKKHDFSKVKTMQQLFNSNLKNHPINKIGIQQDSFSSSSETKTEKFNYGAKKSIQDEILLQQNDYNIMNKKDDINRHDSNNNRVQMKPNNKVVFDKNAVVYKSFKEIGSSNNEISQNKETENEKKKMISRIPYQYEEQYGIQSNIKNSGNHKFTFDKPERKCFSPLPNTFGLRRQNTQRSNLQKSPNTKQTIRQTEIKSFLR